MCIAPLPVHFVWINCCPAVLSPDPSLTLDGQPQVDLSQQGSDGRVFSYTDSPSFPHMPSFPDQLVLPWLESQPRTWQGQERLKHPCGHCCPRSIPNLSLPRVQPQCKRLGMCVCVCWGGGGAQGGRLYTVCPLSRVSPGHLGWGVGWGDAGLRLHMKKPQMA